MGERGLNASSRFQFRMDSPEAEAQRQFDSILLTSQPAQGSVHREAGLSREYLAKGPSGNKVCILARAPGGQMRGAATQAMPVCIVEERQQSRCPPAAAPLRAAAPRPAGGVGRSLHTAPGMLVARALPAGLGASSKMYTLFPDGPLVNPPFSLVIGHLSCLADVLTEQAMMRYIDLGERWKKSMRNDEWPAKNDKWEVGLLRS